MRTTGSCERCGYHGLTEFASVYFGSVAEEVLAIVQSYQVLVAPVAKRPDWSLLAY
jgi:hypothetical protein